MQKSGSHIAAFARGWSLRSAAPRFSAPASTASIMEPAFAEMVGSFDQRVRELKGCASLRPASGSSPPDEQLAESLQSIARSLSAVEASFEALSGAVLAEKQCLQHADVVAAKANEQAALLARILAALPAQLPPDPADRPDAAPLAPVSASGSNTAGRPKSARQPRPKSARKKRPAAVPDKVIEHVTTEEVDGLRRDVKGRMTVDKLNAGIDNLRELLAVKRQLLASKRPSTLKHGDAQRVKDWQALVCEATEGWAFFTEDDLLDPPRGKPPAVMVGASGKSLISALRSLNRVKEIRVNKTKLYLVL